MITPGEVRRLIEAAEGVHPYVTAIDDAIRASADRGWAKPLCTVALEGCNGSQLAERDATIVELRRSVDAILLILQNTKKPVKP